MEHLPKRWDVDILAEQSHTMFLGIYKVKTGQSWPLFILDPPNSIKVNALEQDYMVPLVTVGNKE